MPAPERRPFAERQPLATAAFWSAAGCYTANCALGAATASGRVRSRHRWWHHALYVTTVALTAVALSAALWARPRRYRAAAALLLPAAGAARAT